MILAAFLALRRKRTALCLIVGVAAVSLTGLLTAIASRDAFSMSDLRRHISRPSFPLNEPVSFEGCVVKEGESRGQDVVATVRVLAFLQKGQWTVCSGKGILRVAEPDRSRQDSHEFRLKRGDRVRGWATWNLPRNYQNPGSADSAGLLMRRGVFLIGRIKSSRLLETIPGGCTDPWIRVANTVGARVRDSLEPIRNLEKGQPAAILASLTIGDYSGLDNATREVFQNSGTFHVLVISGLHVAWIAALLLQFFKLICLPERVRYLLAFLAILLYTCVVGFQASITRCLWMFLLYLIGRAIFRRADSVNILLGSAVILLLAQPNWLFEAGFQLSFISVLAIAMTSAPAIKVYFEPICRPLLFAGKPDRLFLQPGWAYRSGRALRFKCELWIEERTDSFTPVLSRILFLICRAFAGAALAIGSLFLTSLAVQIWLQPLLACYFNRMSWISPFSNLVIVPFSSLVLGAGIAGAFTAKLPFLGPALVHLAGWLASHLLSCTSRMTSLPGAWQRCPTPAPGWILAGIVLLFAWSFFEWRRFWIPCTGIVALLACLSFGSVPVFGRLLEELRHATRKPDEQCWKKDASILSITALDVGEGDSAVIRFPDMRVWLVDAGGLRQAPSQEDAAYGFDIGEAVVSRYLWHFWIGRIDRMLLSHADMDHAGGVAAVMQNFRTGVFAYSQSAPDTILTGILDTAVKRKLELRQLHTGTEEKIGPVIATVLNPRANTLLNSSNENSLVLNLSFKRFSALLTGDLEKAGEAEVLSQPGADRCELLKVAHHGSRSGSSDRFLDRVQPRWAVVSVGRNNPFGHPSKETLSRLQRHGTRPILTMDEGAVTFETDGERYVLKSHINGILERGELD